jgi:selenocysteine lyase/cysteine desulfurase
MIYLNCAATSHQRPECVIDAVADALRTFGSSGRGAHESELTAARSIALARERVSALLGFGHPERLVFAANATEALNMVATDWDHNSILRPLYRLRDERGVTVEFAPADRRGVLDFDSLVAAITPGTSLVCLTHASNLTGNVLSREELARVVRAAHAVGAPVLLDCAQTAGARPICMDELGIDLVAFTGHKALMGPQGTGGLAVAPGVNVHPVLRGGTGVLSFEEGQPEGYPEHLEAGTLNGHGIAGLSAAAAWIAEKGLDAIHAHDLALVRRFVTGVRRIGATIYGDFPSTEEGLLAPGFDHAPVVSVNLPGWDSSEVADALGHDYDIAVRAGGHCAPRMHRALGTQDTGAVRFSFGCFTTEEDVDAAIAALAELAAEGEDGDDDATA